MWRRAQRPSFVLTQVPRDTKLDVIVRVGEWYQVVLPPGTGVERVGYIRSNQVAIDSTGPLNTGRACRGHSGRRQQAGAYASGLSQSRLHIPTRRGRFHPFCASLRKRAGRSGAIDANYGNGRGPQYDLLTSQAIWDSSGWAWACRTSSGRSRRTSPRAFRTRFCSISSAP